MTYKRFRKIQVYILIFLISLILTKNFNVILITRNNQRSALKTPQVLFFDSNQPKNEEKANSWEWNQLIKPSFWVTRGDLANYIKEKQILSSSSLYALTDTLFFETKRLIDSLFTLIEITSVSVKVSYKASQKYLAGRREYFLKSLEGSLDSRSLPLAKGLLFGDVSGISQELYHSFKVIGILHVVSASSANFTLFVHFGLWFCRPFLPYFGRKPLFFLHLSLVLCYFCLVGSSPSTSRAFSSLVFGFYSIFYLQRSYLSIYSLLLIGILLLYINPLFLSSLGFQLSFLATFGILFWVASLEKYLNPRGNFVFSSFILSFSAQFFLIPIMISNFGEVNYLAFLANLVLLPLLELLTVSFLILFLTFFVGGAVDVFLVVRFLSFLNHTVMDILFTLINFLEKIPYKSILFKENKELYVNVFIFIQIIIVLLFNWWKNQRYKKENYRIFS